MPGEPIGDDDKTNPGPHGLAEGSPETRALLELATMVRFYSSRLDQLVGEVQRAGLTDPQRGGMARDLRELSRDFLTAADRLSPRK